MARVDTLGHFLTDIADAIREKTGSDALIEASYFDTEIANIPTGGGVDISDYIVTNPTTPAGNTNSQYWWSKKMFLPKFGDIEISVTTSTSSMAYMFYKCPYKYIPKIKSDGMLSTNLYLTSSFQDCSDITTLDLSGLQANVGRCGYAFSGCTSLTKLDVRNLDFTTATTSGSAFSSVPTDCLIIVKNTSNKDWIINKYPSFTNVKTVSEYEGG